MLNNTTALQRIKYYIEARVSDILYHSTGIWNVLSMLEENKIALTSSLGTGADAQQQSKGKYFFLSTTRSKLGQYHFPISKHQAGTCLIVLDGRQLMLDGFSGKPVDYWGPEYKRSKNEMEDRIVSSKSEIKPATKYIKEIHIFFDTKEDRSRDQYRLDNITRVLRKTLLLGKKNGIGMFVYDDPQAFNLLNKAKTVSVADMNLETPPQEPGWVRGKRQDTFAPYTELLYKTDKSQLSKYAKQIVDRHLGLWSKNEFRTIMESDIHNHRSGARGDDQANLVKFINHMKKFKLATVKDYIEAMVKKWNPNNYA